jgi:hypothetical protein
MHNDACNGYNRISISKKDALRNPYKTFMILRQGSCPKDEKPGES